MVQHIGFKIPHIALSKSPLDREKTVRTACTRIPAIDGVTLAH